MGRVMTLELPDETYEVIRAQAMARGATPEEFVVEQLAAALTGLNETVRDEPVTAGTSPAASFDRKHLDMPRAAPPGLPRQRAEQDLLESLIGTLTCDVTDAADRHDTYIGRAVARTGDPRHRPNGG